MYSSFQLVYSVSHWFLFCFLWYLPFFMLLKFSVSFFYHVYNHYCELCIWKIACLHFIRSFSKDFFCSFICGMFVSPFLAALLCMFLCIRSAVTPSICGVVLHSRCPVGPSGTSLPDYLSWCFECVLCMHYVCPPVIFEFWLLLACPWVERD